MFTLWFTGSNCQGEEAIIKKVKEFLEAKGLTVVYLNGSNCISARWAVYVAELLNKQGVVVVASFVPFQFLGFHQFVKQTITKFIEVWVKGADRTRVFAQERCDILVDLNMNSVKSCASLVASYLYLHEVLKFSENGVDPIVGIRESEGHGMENKLRAFLNKGIVDSGSGSVKSANGKSFMTFEAIEDLMGMLEGEELRLLKAIKDKIFETIKAESYMKGGQE
jgi:hypothetical protein